MRAASEAVDTDLTGARRQPLCADGGRFRAAKSPRTGRRAAPHFARDARMETPCIKVCVIEPGTDVCTGCRRSLTEIARWSRLDAAERRRIMAELPARRLPASSRGTR